MSLFSIFRFNLLCLGGKKHSTPNFRTNSGASLYIRVTWGKNKRQNKLSCVRERGDGSLSIKTDI